MTEISLPTAPCSQPTPDKEQKAPISKQPVSGHDPIAELLPWYANGTLTPAELALVEHHLSDCLVCRQELEQYRTLDAACPTLAKQRDWQASSAHFARILQQLQAHEAVSTPPPTRRHLLETVSNWLQYTPKPIAWALALETITLATLLLTLAITTHPTAMPTFETLSDSPKPAIAGLSRVHIVFAEDITERDLRALLTAVHGRLVDGPSLLGVYTLALPAGHGNTPVALATLRAHARVRLAEPVAADAQP
ncbi:MAG: zf-HC2 domain-containing protein [Methylovulum sp.]|nr:zf-HC2 domain-containing protein [Methylovulum sp.]